MGSGPSRVNAPLEGPVIPRSRRNLFKDQSFGGSEWGRGFVTRATRNQREIWYMESGLNRVNAPLGGPVTPRSRKDLFKDQSFGMPVWSRSHGSVYSTSPAPWCKLNDVFHRGHRLCVDSFWQIPCVLCVWVCFETFSKMTRYGSFRKSPGMHFESWYPSV